MGQEIFLFSKMFRLILGPTMPVIHMVYTYVYMDLLTNECEGKTVLQNVGNH